MLGAVEAPCSAFFGVIHLKAPAPFGKAISGFPTGMTTKRAKASDDVLCGPTFFKCWKRWGTHIFAWEQQIPFRNDSKIGKGNGKNEATAHSLWGTDFVWVRCCFF